MPQLQNFDAIEMRMVPFQDLNKELMELNPGLPGVRCQTNELYQLTDDVFKQIFHIYLRIPSPINGAEV